VLILYDGAIVAELEGDAMTEHNIVASAHGLVGSASTSRAEPV
jgi:hypothetical protein